MTEKKNNYSEQTAKMKREYSLRELREIYKIADLLSASLLGVDDDVPMEDFNKEMENELVRALLRDALHNFLHSHRYNKAGYIDEV